MNTVQATHTADVTAKQYRMCSVRIDQFVRYCHVQHETCYVAQRCVLGVRFTFSFCVCGSVDTGWQAPHPPPQMSVPFRRRQFLPSSDVWQIKSLDAYVICGGKSDNESSFSFPPIISIFPFHHHFTIALCSFVCHLHCIILSIYIVVK